MNDPGKKRNSNDKLHIHKNLSVICVTLYSLGSAHKALMSISNDAIILGFLIISLTIVFESNILNALSNKGIKGSNSSDTRIHTDDIIALMNSSK